MSFSVPTFNLHCGVWHLGLLQPAPPDLLVFGNLAWGRRVNPGQGGVIGIDTAFMTLLLPAGTDIRSDINSPSPDHVEVPIGSGRLYEVVVVDDIGKGFANEHRAAILVQFGLGSWPVPMP